MKNDWRYLLVFICFVFSIVSFAQNRKPKKLISTEFYFRETKIGFRKKDKQLSHFIFYNKNGQEIEYALYGEEYTKEIFKKHGPSIIERGEDYSKIATIAFYYYDSSGNKIKKETWLYKNNNKDKLSDHTNYVYSERGLLKKEVSFNDLSGLEEIMSFVYDKSDNKIEGLETDVSGKDTTLGEKELWFYDTRNRVDSTFYFFSDGQLLQKSLFLYEGNDKVTELTYDYMSKDSTIYKIRETTTGNLKYFPYTKERLETYEKRINSSFDEQEDDVYYYNKWGLVYKIKHYSGLKLTGCTKFKYQYY